MSPRRRPDVKKLQAKRDTRGLIKALRYRDREVGADAAHALYWTQEWGKEYEK